MSAKFVSIDPHTISSREANRLFLSAVVPRPIAWVSSLGADGTTNLAPFSFFMAVASHPPVIAISIGQKKGKPKDSLRNLTETGEFVCHLVDESLAESMNETSIDVEYGVNEFDIARLLPVPGDIVKAKRICVAPVAMEGKVIQIVPVTNVATTLVLGEIVRYHIREDLLTAEKLINAGKLGPITRLGGEEYGALGRVFSMKRPSVEPKKASDNKEG